MIEVPRDCALMQEFEKTVNRLIDDVATELSWSDEDREAYRASYIPAALDQFELMARRLIPVLGRDILHKSTALSAEKFGNSLPGFRKLMREWWQSKHAGQS